jgi:parallel beta-helix repeat protein
MTWTASTDPGGSGVVGYVIIRDGLEVGRTVSCSFVDINLADGCSYDYEVRAYDRQGNFSADDGATQSGVQTGISNADYYVDATNGDDANLGTSTSAPKKTIQSAIDSASAGDLIVVLEGRYIESVEIDKNIILVGQSGATKTIIDCEGTSNRVLNIQNTSNYAAVVDGFTILGGKTTTADGGGINISSTVVVGNCLVKNGSAVNGGGIAISGSGVKPVIANCEIRENSSSANGGGIYYSNSAKPIIKACSIFSNTASGMGGGIYGED